MAAFRISTCYYWRTIPKTPFIAFTNGNAVGEINCQRQAASGIVGNALNKRKCACLYPIKFKIDLKSRQVAFACTA